VWIPSAYGRSKGDLTGANPVDPGTRGSKLHLAGDAGGLPLSVVAGAANANDSTMLEAVLEDIPPIRMPTGRRRRRPGKVHADNASEHRRHRGLPAPAWHPLADRSPHDRIQSSAGLGRRRWTIERTEAWAGRLAAAADPVRALL
jgi:transposase